MSTGGMTPEERAGRIPWPDDLIGMSKEDGDALVAAAIRAAENDALDRAYTAIKALFVDDEADHWDAYVAAAKAVRALKHTT